ncbi:MAG: hypothetical protein IJU62_05710 [Muribaculaceae bacterium]|nr:hypothetical protein [Muribaculaceae bacterium]
MRHYRVRYRVVESLTTTSINLMLHSASESEAIATLKQRGTVGRDKTIIILSIDPI